MPGDPRISLPLLADRDVAATYASTAFSVTALTTGGFDISYEPSAPTVVEHLALTVPGPGFVTCVPASAELTLPEGPTLETVTDALAWQPSSDFLQALTTALASVGVVPPGWVVIEGATFTEVVAALPALVVESEAQVQMGTEASASADLVDAVRDGTHTLAIDDTVTTLGTIVASGARRALRIRAFYASGEVGSEVWTEGNCLGFFAAFATFDDSLEGLGILEALRNAARSTPNIDFFVSFSVFAAADSGTRSDTVPKGHQTPLPVGTVAHLVDASSGDVLVPGAIASDGYVKFTVGSTETTSVPRSTFSGHASVCLRVLYEEDILRQYFDDPDDELASWPQWNGVAGVWETTLSESETQVPGVFMNLSDSATTMFGSADAPLRFHVGTELFLAVSYTIRYETESGEATIPAPRGLPVQVWDTTPPSAASSADSQEEPSSSTTGYLGTFYTDDDGQVFGTLLSRRAASASLVFRIPLTMRELREPLLCGARVVSSTGETAYALDHDRLFYAGSEAIEKYGIGAGKSPAAGGRIAVGTAGAPLTVAIGAGASSSDAIRTELFAAAVFALRNVRDANGWWAALTEEAETSWGDYLDERRPEYHLVLTPGTSLPVTYAEFPDGEGPVTMQLPVRTELYYSDPTLSTSVLWRRPTHAHEFTHFVVNVVIDGINYLGDYDDEDSACQRFNNCADLYVSGYAFSGAYATDKWVIKPKASRYDRDTFMAFEEGLSHLVGMFFAPREKFYPDTWFGSAETGAVTRPGATGEPEGLMIWGNDDIDPETVAFTFTSNPDANSTYDEFHWNLLSSTALSETGHGRNDNRVRRFGLRIIGAFTFSLFGPLRNDPTHATGDGRHFDRPPNITEGAYYSDYAPMLRILTESSTRTGLDWGDPEGSALLENPSSGGLTRMRALFEHLVWHPLLLLASTNTNWKDWNEDGNALEDVDYPSSTAFIRAVELAWFTGDSTACPLDIDRVKNWLTFNNLWVA